MAPTSSSALEQALSNTLDKRRSQLTLRRLTTSPPDSVDFSSNDFLSLASSAELRERFLNELQTPTIATAIGSGGSRLLDGNSHYAETLEKDISAFHGAPAGLLCNSGYDANVSLFSCLPQPDDVILYDELIHASVHDGMRLSRAGKCLPFAHNSVEALAARLRELCQRDERIRSGQRNVFVAVEAVYSMDGDVAPLRNISSTMRSALPNGNGHLLVDEAHSTGVLGPQGTGLVCELGMENEVFTRLHTFGKALACNGAIILCSPLVRQYLINYARPLIYTTFMSYPCLAAIRASYSLLMEKNTQPLQDNVLALMSELHVRLLGLEESLKLPLHFRNLMRTAPGRPRSAISYVLSSRSKSLAAYCQRRGLVVRGVVPPTVPVGGDRIRICLHAGNTSEQVERLVDAIRSWVCAEREAIEAEERREGRRQRL